VHCCSQHAGPAPASGAASPSRPPAPPRRPPLRPQLLGRAENLKDYVQRGCEEAWTEITLSGGPGAHDMVVRRQITQVVRDDGATGYTTKWRLNGARARQRGARRRGSAGRGASGG
jgi:hypothetical protein